MSEVEPNIRTSIGEPLEEIRQQLNFAHTGLQE